MPYSRALLSLPDGPLFSERLRYDKLTKHDELAMWDMVSSPEVMRYIPLEVETNFTAWRARYQKEVDKGERFKFFYGFKWRDPDAVERATLGLVILRPTEDQKFIELGYWVRHDFWGMGLASEANRAMIVLAKTINFPTKDHIATVEVGNHASRRVLEKCGMEVMETSEVDGELCWVLKNPTP